MNSKRFSEAMNELDDRYIEEAMQYGKKQKKSVWVKWGTMAACLCLIVAGGLLFTKNSTTMRPDPDPVQIPSPIITVASVEEMEKYLDFQVPVLDKEAASYSVFVEGDRPVMGQIDYADGSQFRMEYGSGDISGIYGGTLEETKEIEGVTVEYYRYEDTTYAIWETNGFAFSYVYTDDGGTDVETFINGETS